MYKHILVAIDESPTSGQALREALALARLHGAGLEIAHAVDESLVPAFQSHGVVLADSRNLENAMYRLGESVLEEAAAVAREAGLSPRTRLLVSEDLHAADQIAQAVEQSGADLLVVGSHGRRGFQRLILGSVAEKLVRKVQVSVLIVRGVQAA